MGRSERRYRTQLIGARRQRIHKARNHSYHYPPNYDGFIPPVCICDEAAGIFYKKTAFGCDCRSRRKGTPKLGTGIGCKAGIGDWRPAVQERINSRRIVRAWLKQLRTTDPEDLEGWFSPGRKY